MKTFVLLFAGLIIINRMQAQPGVPLSGIESFIASQHLPVNSSHDLDSLAKIIIAKYPDSLSRVKAAYVWVAKNITYTELNEKGRFQHSASHIDSVLKYKSTICAGYVNVFCLLCNKVGITCQQIEGFGRTGTQSFINTPFSVNHAWAAVWLNEKWNLTDVTWGSGYTLEGTHNFVSATNDYYFFTEPEIFVLDHYPKQTNWQLLQDTISWQQFISYPGVCLGAKENEVSNCSPAQSLIRSKAGDKIEFAFKSKKELQSIILFSKQKGFEEKGLLHKKNDTYTYTYIIPAAGEYDLQIDLNNYDITKPGSYSSLIDFVYFVTATAKK